MKQFVIVDLKVDEKRYENDPIYKDYVDFVIFRLTNHLLCEAWQIFVSRCCGELFDEINGNQEAYDGKFLALRSTWEGDESQRFPTDGEGNLVEYIIDMADLVEIPKPFEKIPYVNFKE